MVTGVWGAWHVGTFLRLALPTLLAENNLPALAHKHDLRWWIYSTPSDAKAIQASAEFARLKEHVETRLVFLSESEIGNPIVTHQAIWMKGIAHAHRHGFFVALIPPDGAWSDGTFGHFADLLAEGKKAIFMNYMRVLSETFAPALIARYRRSDGTITVPHRDLVRLGLAHIHPMLGAYLADSLRFTSHPEYVHRPVRNEGVLVRQLGRELFLFDTQRFRPSRTWLLDQEFSSDEVYLLTDSDNGFGVGVAPMGKDFVMHEVPQRADPMAIARWWLPITCRSTDFILRRPLRWHCRSMTAPAWRHAECMSALLLHRAAAAREGLQVWRAAKILGCHEAAKFIALALHTGLIARAFPRGAPAIVLLPTDRAIKALPRSLREELYRAQGTKLLIDFLRAHVVLRAESASGVGSWNVGNAPVRRGAGAVEAGAHMVCTIDRVLAPSQTSGFGSVISDLRVRPARQGTDPNRHREASNG